LLPLLPVWAFCFWFFFPLYLLPLRNVRFLSELLLGPMHPEYLPLYSRETQVRSAFIRKHIAYIDISADALSPVKTIVSQEKAYELFKKNVCTNYRNIDKIYLYIDGIEVYPETPIASAKTNKKR
jgi:hypothetical protein